jgi:hypothetical protein
MVRTELVQLVSQAGLTNAEKLAHLRFGEILLAMQVAEVQRSTNAPSTRRLLLVVVPSGV